MTSTEPTTDKPATPKTFTQQMKDPLALPFWMALSFFIYGASAGMFGGMVMQHSKIDPYLSAILALVALIAPTVPGILRRLRGLKKDTAAVSPVIGTILMVAITVVLAAVVFYLVSSLANNTDTGTPTLSFRQQDHGATYLLLHAPNGLDWSDFTVSGCTTVPTGDMDAGDQLKACTGTVTVVHNDSNTVAWTNGEGP